MLLILWGNLKPQPQDVDYLNYLNHLKPGGAPKAKAKATYFRLSKFFKLWALGTPPGL